MDEQGEETNKSREPETKPHSGSGKSLPTCGTRARGQLQDKMNDPLHGDPQGAVPGNRWGFLQGGGVREGGAPRGSQESLLKQQTRQLSGSSLRLGEVRLHPRALSERACLGV